MPPVETNLLFHTLCLYIFLSHGVSTLHFSRKVLLLPPCLPSVPVRKTPSHHPYTCVLFHTVACIRTAPLKAFHICTLVPSPGELVTCTRSMNASIKANPMPLRSLSALVVNMGCIALSTSSIPHLYLLSQLPIYHSPGKPPI